MGHKTVVSLTVCLICESDIISLAGLNFALWLDRLHTRVLSLQRGNEFGIDLSPFVIFPPIRLFRGQAGIGGE